VLHSQQRHALRKSVLQGKYELPIRRKPAPALAAGTMPLTVPISAEIDLSAPRQSTTVLVGGKEVDVEITYLGPLPQ
jgi:hypothetical protein